MARAIAGDLRTARYQATGTLQRTLDPAGRMSRDDFGRLLDAMSRAGLIEIEDAEYEKEGQVAIATPTMARTKATMTPWLLAVEPVVSPRSTLLSILM